MQENTEVPKMPKANKKAQCEPHTSDTVPPEEETNSEQGSESEQEVFIRQHKPPQLHMYLT